MHCPLHRQDLLGLPPDTPGGTVQRQCATGMMAVQEAAATFDRAWLGSRRPAASSR